MNPALRRLCALILVSIVSLLAACGGESSSEKPADRTTGAWPRSITDSRGEVTIPARPKRIVSTSMVLTGTLLALDAPVVGTGASKPGAAGLDDQGLFLHWAPIAKERGVEVLFKNSEINLEAVAGARPDLILVAKTGGDSFMQAYDQLARMAPVVVIDYNALDWQEVTRLAAVATGEEARGDQVLRRFDDRVAELGKTVKAPVDPVQMVVFSPGSGLAFAKVNGPHDKILQRLGVPLDKRDLSQAGDGSGGKGRGDFVFLSEENSVAALTASHLLLVGGDAKDLDAMRATPAYANTPPLRGGTVTPLGLASFKLDYYSALDMADHLAGAFRG